MRARNIKPGLFLNEVLGVADPLYTILFEGLWCIADRAGRLEDRPARIAASALPHRSNFDTDAALTWLAHNGFIVRYTVDKINYIQVVNFEKHQYINIKEKESTIPAPMQNSKKIVKNINSALKSECLKTEVLNTEACCADTNNPVDTGPVDAKWLEIKNAYPKRAGGQRWVDAEKAYRKQIRDGFKHELILAGVVKYAKCLDAIGKSGSQFVMQAGTFLGNGMHWAEDYEMPNEQSGGAAFDVNNW